MEVFPTKRPRELVSLLVSAHSLLEKTIGDMVSSSSVKICQLSLPEVLVGVGCVCRRVHRGKCAHVVGVSVCTMFQKKIM